MSRAPVPRPSVPWPARSLVGLHVHYSGSLDLTSLGDLPNLTWLKVSVSPGKLGLWREAPRGPLETISLFKKVHDLAAIGRLKHLDTLDLSSCEIPDDLEALGECANLAHLRMPTLERPTDLSFLVRAKGLRNLDVNFQLPGRVAPDLSIIGSLTQLEFLSMDVSPGPHSIAPFGKLTNLVGLKYGSQETRDISAIRSLHKLKYLDLEGCNVVEDFSFLGSMPHLEKLVLDCTNVGDLSFIRRLPALRYISVSNCYQLRDGSPLDDLIARGGVVDPHEE